MVDEKEEHYKFLFYKAIEDKNLNLLKSIPEIYIPEISSHVSSLQSYCKENNLLNIKYIMLDCESNFIIHSILRYACMYKRINIVKYLIENVIDIHNQHDISIRTASSFGCLDIVEYLIKNGADIHANNDEALQYASQNGHLNVVKYLIENGADVFVSNDYAIIVACENEHLDIVKYLLSFYENKHEMESILSYINKNNNNKKS